MRCLYSVFNLRIFLTCFLLQQFVPVVECIWLLAPQFSVIQLTLGVSTPAENISKPKLFLDWAIQFNFDMPFNATSFYDPPIWPDLYSGPKSRKFDMNKSTEGTHSSKSRRKQRMTRPNDFTAGELYMTLQELLVTNGYHSSCLLRSICELALHPFDQQKENSVESLLTFILSPSIHQGFSSNEHRLRQQYEEAERQGNAGFDCSSLYPKCSECFLETLTNIFY